MNRPSAPQPHRPMRDHVRVSPGTRNASSSPKEHNFDDLKVMTLLQSADKELHGLRLVHLHLSLLSGSVALELRTINRLLSEAAANAAYSQIYNISNGDILMFFKGLKFSAVEEACKKIEAILLGITQMTGANPYREAAVYSILELSLNFVHVLRYLEGITKVSTVAGDDIKPPITPEELAKIDSALGQFDLSPYLFNQAVIDLHDDDKDHREYYELYFSVKGLEKKLSPDFDLSSDRWLFAHFTSSLDASLLRTLNHGFDFIGKERIGININLSTAMSPMFQKFDDRLPATFRGRVTLEIGVGDLVEHLPLYRDLLRLASDRDYRICIDGLNSEWATQFDFEELGCDYAKIFWSSDMLAMEPGPERALSDKLTAARDTKCRFVLARCGAMTGLLYAEKHGIDLVQGHAVDAILRKGIKVGDAIKTALILDR